MDRRVILEFHEGDSTLRVYDVPGGVVLEIGRENEEPLSHSLHAKEVEVFEGYLRAARFLWGAS